MTEQERLRQQLQPRPGETLEERRQRVRAVIDARLEDELTTEDYDFAVREGLIEG
ncbi:hypothetical protein HNR42_000762 [Deinobacterium chartae]|uniref:Uncharacterized protein n=1 Tax=Deinobacterium chartae TaxID=521158 RepID=A0A841HZC7_9DEIO|nr:hypothetical protein [Deinobacterium chartae]MBB6097348.1 hypothetical protein [Deinobacterium chartae]